MRRVAVIATLLVLSIARPASAVTTDLQLDAGWGHADMLDAGGCGAGSQAIRGRFTGEVRGIPLPLAHGFDSHLELRVSGEAGDDPVPAAMGADDNFLKISTPRGDVFALQVAGTCDSGTISVRRSGDRVVANGYGVWAVTGGTRSYRGASGGGLFVLAATFGPGVSNPMRLELYGDVGVRRPAPSVALQSVRYAEASDYLTRQVSVTFRVTNAGEGDAYRTIMRVENPAPASVELLDYEQARPDALTPGATSLLTFRFRVPADVCFVALFGCSFRIDSRAFAEDALDQPVPEVKDTWTIALPTTPL